MKYKTKYSFLFSIGLILYFILKDSNLVFKNTIPLLFTIVPEVLATGPLYGQVIYDKGG